MTGKPEDKTEDTPTVEPSPAPEPVEVEVAKDITEIKSWDDAKEVVVDGFDKLRNSSADELKQGALRVGNRIFKAWRKLVDGD